MTKIISKTDCGWHDVVVFFGGGSNFEPAGAP